MSTELWVRGGKWRETKRREEVRRREGEVSDTFYPAGEWVVSFTGLRWRFTCSSSGGSHATHLAHDSDSVSVCFRD